MKNKKFCCLKCLKNKYPKIVKYPYLLISIPVGYCIYCNELARLYDEEYFLNSNL